MNVPHALNFAWYHVFARLVIFRARRDVRCLDRDEDVGVIVEVARRKFCCFDFRSREWYQVVVVCEWLSGWLATVRIWQGSTVTPGQRACRETQNLILSGQRHIKFGYGLETKQRRRSFTSFQISRDTLHRIQGLGTVSKP